MANLLFALAAYLIGSVSFAVVVSKLMGLPDPHSYGSGNPGATNVLRTGNKKAAILTLIGDALKGWLAVWLAARFGPAYGLNDTGLAMVALSVFLGHLFPVFHRFAGGKGVATAAGILLAINPVLGLGTLATWLIIAFFFRYSSLASIVAAVFAPFYQLLIWGGGPVTLAILAMSLLLVWRHSANISRLFAGTEGKIGAKAAAPPPVAQPQPHRPHHPRHHATHRHSRAQRLHK